MNVASEIWGQLREISFYISPLVPELSSDNIQCSLSCPSVASVDLLASPTKTKRHLVIKPSSSMGHCNFLLE